MGGDKGGRSEGRGSLRGELGRRLGFYLLRKAQASRSAVDTTKREIQTLVSFVIKTPIKQIDPLKQRLSPPFPTSGMLALLTFPHGPSQHMAAGASPAWAIPGSGLSDRTPTHLSLTLTVP